MPVEIKTITRGEEYTVNGKSVYKDSNGNWVAREELTESEFVAFRRHKKIQNDNDRYFAEKKV